MKFIDEKPDKIIIENSGKAFFEVIHELKPDAIIFFSIAAYNAVPYNLEGFDIKYLKDKGNEVYPFKQNNNHSDNAYLSYYEHEGKEIPILAFPHLTRKYSVMKVKDNLQNEVIREVIQVSKIQNILKN